MIPTILQNCSATYVEKVLGSVEPRWWCEVDALWHHVASTDVGGVGLGEHNDELSGLLYDATEWHASLYQ